MDFSDKQIKKMQKQAKERAKLIANYTKIFYDDWEAGVDRVKEEIKEYKNKFNNVERKLKSLV